MALSKEDKDWIRENLHSSSSWKVAIGDIQKEQTEMKAMIVKIQETITNTPLVNRTVVGAVTLILVLAFTTVVTASWNFIGKIVSAKDASTIK